jgi:hypothetical protein
VLVKSNKAEALGEVVPIAVLPFVGFNIILLFPPSILKTGVSIERYC